MTHTPIASVSCAQPYRAFAERWVYGRGCPRLTLFWHYTTKKATEVKLDFIQEGCQGSLEGVRLRRRSWRSKWAGSRWARLSRAVTYATMCHLTS